MLTIVAATTPEQVEHVRTLLRDYERSLGIDLAFQGFAQEVAALPGVYAPPRGRLLLAMDNDAPAGCVALRPITDDVCEMKRLYLRLSLRGKGAGRMLAGRIIDEARAIGYRTMRLDSLPAMKEAIALYEALGFQRIAPYYTNPVPGTVYLERTL